jgi:5-methylcytosine-specific restriction endonuclease McrA
LRKHTKIYFNHFGFGIDSYVPCELCGSKAVDIHHIDARGMGGSKSKDVIENLMAVCRPCHEKFGDKSQYIDFIQDRHNEYISRQADKEVR